jgi:hypothetical protein
MPSPMSSLPPSESLLFGLLKLLTIVMQPDRGEPRERKLVIPRHEVQAVGLDEAHLRGLLTANYVKEWRGEGDQFGLTLTEEGLALIAAQVGGIAPVSRVHGAKEKQPHWVSHQGGGGELRFRGELVKRVRHDSQGQRRILDEFESTGWPQWILNPLIAQAGLKRKKALRDAIQRLNGGQDPLRVRFHVHDGGACWEIVG